MTQFKIDITFINREREMAELRNYLEGRPNSILFLYGPKSSGKTTLMYRLFEHMEAEKGYKINFLNLRKIFLTTSDDFIDAFFKSSSSGNGLKTGTRRKYSLFGLFKLDAFTEKMLKKRQEDPFLVMEREFQRLLKKGIQPVVIIDEFHKLDGLYLPDKQKRLMVELMNFFVAMTKESHLCHVIIASSDAFFIEQVYVNSKLRKTSEFMKLDYLEKEDVLVWLRDIKKYNQVQEYTLDEKQIETIWDTVGGSAWEIYYILRKLLLYSLDAIASKIKREKVSMIADWTFGDEARNCLLRHFRKQPIRKLAELAGTGKDLLGQAVKDNILYYDPVDGIYGIQGKSLEWGIKGYFEEVISSLFLNNKKG
ncbi:ATP-binding protein [Desulfosarcina sp. BuS5]|uniref:ATP-binding protein n=1 Tax=Desulfosarcina sp. BuS5 TaxID=933262 RepID=UPI00054E2441|nr:ATP-binding protein [Desulfosarcina sp. BuS5]